MFTSLRPYQIEDAVFLSKRNSAALFNEQRTGKTPTVLYALELLHLTRAVIVCPSSAMWQWVNEYGMWTGRKAVMISGLAVERKKLLQTATEQGFAIVISYDLLRMHGDDLAKVLAYKPEVIILDEAHRIRNPKTRTAKAIFKFRNVPHKYCLTGTPTMNHTYEVWSILHFLYPHTFKSYWKFIETFFYTEKKINRRANKTYVDIGEPNEQGQTMFAQVLPRISRERKRKDVMEWLPDKEYVPIGLEPTAKQQRYLKELLEVWETDHVVTVGHLDRLIRYRQICLDPSLLELKGTSPKTDWVMQYLEDYPDRPTLIFSKFTSYLEKLSKLIKTEHGKIIGATATQRRGELCTAFQTGKIKLLLINIDAGKEALTLDKAEAVIFTDRYPPVGDLAQAEDRFVATQKDRADKDHIVYQLFMRNTYDEDINEMIKDRYNETEIINNWKTFIERRKAHGNRTKL